MFPSLCRFAALAWILPMVVLVLLFAGCAEPLAPAPPQGPDGYLFCFWNVENLFDDRDDNRPTADEEYDNWFSRDSAALQLKLDRLSDALIKLNDGKGPDILALAEVENERAADLLRQALNRRLADETWHYPHVLMKDIAAGRHIAPAIITRLPARPSKTQVHGRQLRIIEGHVSVAGHDLVIIASHWTSRLTDETGERRAKYGDQIYGVFAAMHRSNPRVDFLVCGDCNDPPDSLSITRHLHATGDLEEVRRAAEPRLFSLFAGKDPARNGTHNFQTKWFIYDQLFASPGLLDDEGWTCMPASVQTVNGLSRPGDKQARPWRFGGEKDKGERGYSDHFPVTVRLKVQPN